MYLNHEYELLTNIYMRNRSDIVVCYGEDRCGISTLIKSFVKNKSYIYYKASDVEPSLQADIFANQMYNQIKLPKVHMQDYQNIFSTFLDDKSNSKHIIIIDCFQFLLNETNSYINYICDLISEENNNTGLMFIFCTNDVFFVENELKDAIGDKLYEISAVIKVTPQSLSSLISEKKDYKSFNVYQLYACFGGNALFWNNAISSEDLKNEIITNFLNDNSIVYQEGNNILPVRLRQQSLYNTLLCYISQGFSRLNDLYDKTGIDRAKLSVYLKSLISYNLIEKIEVKPIGKPSNIAKAVYKIKDPFVHFWYYFIYPNISTVAVLGPEKFYKKVILQGLPSYMQFHYAEYCKHIINKSTNSKIIDLKNCEIYKYLDKSGVIDFIVQTPNKTYACSCNISNPHLVYKDYEKVLESIKNAGLKNTSVILFSMGGFDQKLRLSSHVIQDLFLYDEKEGFLIKQS